MSAILFAILGHLANAVAALIDKLLLNTGFKHSATYAVAIGGLSTFALFAWPFFDAPVLTWRIIVHATLFGGAFFVGLWRFFAGLKQSETGSFVPLTAATVALSSLFLELFLTWDFSVFATHPALLAGIALLIVSMLFIAVAQRTKGYALALQPALESGGFFAVSSVNATFLYHETSFVQGFLLSRIALVLCVIMALIGIKEVRQELFIKKKGEDKPLFLFLVGQFIGTLGFLGVQFALSLPEGSASLVNALQAVQFSALALITGVFGKWLPQSLREHWTGTITILKITALVLATLGLSLIAR